MGFFDFTVVSAPVVPIDIESYGFLSIPKSWDSKIGKETLAILKEIETERFLIGHKWKDSDWNKKKFPAFSWPWLSKMISCAVRDTIELESLGIRFRNPDHKYTLKEFLVQDWKDKANPWSPFLCSIFGTSPEGKVPIAPGKYCSKMLIVKHVQLVNCDDEIHDSIYED